MTRGDRIALAKCRPFRTDGFTLVEVTLAILVVSIGLLTVLGLFPTGLAMNKKSIDETQAAMFAEEVMSEIRARAYGDTNTWEHLADIYVGTPTVGMWWNPSANRSAQEPDPFMRVMATATPRTIQHISSMYIVAGESRTVDSAWRYTLLINNEIPGRIKSARLRVWNGEFGSTNLADAIEFYTEFYNFGKM